MDEIDAFLDDFIDRYPKYWTKIDDYLDSFLRNQLKDPFSNKSKYIKVHICKSVNGKISYIPKEKASLVDIEKSVTILNMELLDYEQIFSEKGKDWFDIEEWCSERLETEIKEVREFLFNCNSFKGRFFLHKLGQHISEIEKNLDNLWTSIEPNWLQIKIAEELKENLKHLKEIVREDFAKDFAIDTTKSNSKSKLGNWYKIAELMANGTIIIDDNGHYYFNGNLIKVEKEMSELVAKELNQEIKPQSIKPYLNRTKIESYDDKNIFRDFRIKELTIIAAEAENKGILSDFYKSRLKKLKQSVI